MPTKNLNVEISRKVDDLKAVRLQGKSLDQLTLAELVAMRPGGGGAEASDSYSINAFTDNVSVSTSSLVEQVGQMAKERAMREEVDTVRLQDIRGKLGTVAGTLAGTVSRVGG